MIEESVPSSEHAIQVRLVERDNVRDHRAAGGLFHLTKRFGGRVQRLVMHSPQLRLRLRASGQLTICSFPLSE